MELGEGSLTFIRPGQLAKDGTTGVILQGEFKGSIPNAPSMYDEEGGNKPDFEFKTLDGDKVIINHTSSLSALLGRVGLGDMVEIVYNGKKEITNKKGHKVKVHDFKVRTQDTDAA
jgi:hypothetical protein